MYLSLIHNSIADVGQGCREWLCSTMLIQGPRLLGSFHLVRLPFQLWPPGLLWKENREREEVPKGFCGQIQSDIIMSTHFSQPSCKGSGANAAYLYTRLENKMASATECFSSPPLSQETLEGANHVPWVSHPLFIHFSLPLSWVWNLAPSGNYK